MFGTHDLALFIVSGLLLNMAPGPDSLLIMARSATQGWRAGLVAGLGVCTGTFVHIVAAALGLSAVLSTSASAFTVLKYIGAAYLLYAGLSLLFARGKAAVVNGQPPSSGTPPVPFLKIFWQGFLTNVLNPKVALFFLAFVPQFIAPEAPNKALAFMVLGGLFNINSLLWSLVLAVSTAFASQRLNVGGGLARWLNRLIGALFVSFGIKLALSDRG